MTPLELRFKCNFHQSVNTGIWQLFLCEQQCEFWQSEWKSVWSNMCCDIIGVNSYMVEIVKFPLCYVCILALWCLFLASYLEWQNLKLGIDTHKSVKLVSLE